MIQRRVVKLEGVQKWRVEEYQVKLKSWFFQTREAGWYHAKTWDLGGRGDGPGWHRSVFGSKQAACDALKRTERHEAVIEAEKRDRWVEDRCEG